MVLTLRSGVVSARFEDGEVLHDSHSGRLFTLNSSAATILNAVRTGVGDDEIVDTIARNNTLPTSLARRDVQAFLGSLTAADLLESGSPDDRPLTTPAAPPETDAALVASYRLGARTTRVICHSEDVALAFRHVAAPAQAANDVPTQATLTLFQHQDLFDLLEDDRLIDRVSTARGARWSLVRELVSEGRGRRWSALLHASAVQTPDGCLLLCGESGAGKSTLLAGLVHAGFPFIADDVALLERGSNMIWPTPFAISIKEQSWPLVSRLFPALAEAPIVRFGDRVMRHLHPPRGRIAADAGQPIAGVLFVRYLEGASALIEPLSARQSLERLGQGGSILPDSEDTFGDFLSLWRRVPAWHLTYGTLDDAISEIRELGENASEPATASSAASH